MVGVKPVLCAESAVLLPPRPRPSHPAGPGDSHTAKVVAKCFLETLRHFQKLFEWHSNSFSHGCGRESLPFPRSLGRLSGELLENYRGQALCCASGMYQPFATAGTSALRVPRAGERLSWVDSEDKGWGSSHGQEVTRSPGLRAQQVFEMSSN